MKLYEMEDKLIECASLRWKTGALNWKILSLKCLAGAFLNAKSPLAFNIEFDIYICSMWAINNELTCRGMTKSKS